MNPTRRLLVLTTAAASALGAPAAAAAHTRTTELHFHHGHTANDVVFRLTRHTRLEIRMRLSDFRFPGARFRVMLRRDDGGAFHTLFTTASCQGAAGSIVCFCAIHSRPPGRYRLRVRKLTAPGADAEIRVWRP